MRLMKNVPRMMYTAARPKITVSTRQLSAKKKKKKKNLLFTCVAETLDATVVANLLEVIKEKSSKWRCRYLFKKNCKNHGVD